MAGLKVVEMAETMVEQKAALLVVRLADEMADLRAA